MQALRCFHGINTVTALALMAEIHDPRRFALPASGKVQLEVFDTQGRRVRALSDQRYDAGSYSVSWDQRDSGGKSVPPGVYLYRLQVGSCRDQKKLIVLP